MTDAKNPFEQPHAAVTPPKEPGRMTLIIGALAVLALSAAGHEVARMSYIQVLVAGGSAGVAEVGRIFAWASVAAPIFAALSCVAIGIRSSIILGAAIGLGALAAGHFEMLEAAVIGSSVSKGTIELAIYAALGRRTLREPESRDAWFVSTLIAIKLGSTVGSVIGAFTNATTIPMILWPVFGAAFLLAAAPTAFVTIPEPQEQDGARVPPSFRLAMVVALVSIFASNIAGSLQTRVSAQIPGSLPYLGGDILTLLLAVTATVVFASRSTPISEDRARQKIGAGAVAGGFACALVAAGLVSIGPAFWAHALLESARYVLVGRIALGLAASLPTLRRSIAAVAGYMLALALLQSGGSMLASLGTWIAWPGALASLALGAAACARRRWHRS